MSKLNEQYDVVIIGAGAAGLFCASQVGLYNKKVLLIDHANRVGKKILMSGGGRCNFTNLYTSPDDFLCSNPHFVKSALSQYSQWDFIQLVEAHGIPYHEKTQGQLFCDRKASDIVQMLVSEAQKQAVDIRTHCAVEQIDYNNPGFSLKTALGDCHCQYLVIATGGLSIPTMGASGFGYDVGQQFGHQIVPTRAALVPFVWDERRKQAYQKLSGISCPVIMSCNDYAYTDQLLFTHRGISGPAALKLSSHWNYGDSVTINFVPQHDLNNCLHQAKINEPRQQLNRFLKPFLPNQIAGWLIHQLDPTMGQLNLADLSNKQIDALIKHICHWTWVPADTEGYRTAEVTLGGISTDEISSQTLESKRTQGLYFIGEVVDVTGQLGGFNFQWAWSSAYAAAQGMAAA